MSVRTGNFKKKVSKLELEKSILKDLLKKPPSFLDRKEGSSFYIN